MAKKKEFNIHGYVLAWLRRGSYRVPMRYEALNSARIERGKYKCATCNEIFGRKDIQVDHIEPVVDPKVGFVDWETFIQRLFCPASGLQVLCKPCHKVKSLVENEQRRVVKKKKLQSEQPEVKIKRSRKKRYV
jgi:5-methylcytosine-specific restriction endonuclease McrA